MILDIQTTYERALRHPLSSPPSERSEQEAALLRTILYYDVFAYPLRVEEMLQFVAIWGIGKEEAEETLWEMRREKIVDCCDGYWFVAARGSAIVERRRAMEIEGERMWRIARRIGGVMKRVPFVRGVFISGQLCHYVADAESDIDYFIVTAPGRLWIARTLMVLFRRTILLNNRKYFCVNYFVSEENLTVRERNLYVACETVSVKPLWNRELYAEFARRNRWVRNYYPAFDIDAAELRAGVPEGRSALQRLLERLIPTGWADALDTRLMEMTRRFWRRKFPDRDPELYAVHLRCDPDESRAHPSDVGAEILHRYRAGLSAHGLSEV
jgi:hypothetical protein